MRCTLYMHLYICLSTHTHMMHLTQIRVYKCSRPHAHWAHNVTRHLAALFILPLTPNMFLYAAPTVLFLRA